MILTVDVGNSRIKWAAWQADKIVARDVVGYAKQNPSEAFEELFIKAEVCSDEQPSRVLAVCVADDRVASVLSNWVKQRWNLGIEYLKTEKHYKDIVNAYHDPGQHGVDRWAGVIAGHQHLPGVSVCVISAGTAITFDLINKDGRHLGGFILPSYATMHAALLTDTANVKSVSGLRSSENNIPDNTNDAVNQGLHKMLQAGIRELCRFAEDNMDGPMEIILTGGFAEAILEYQGMPVMHHVPDLVMQGLYEVMTSSERQQVKG